MSPAIWLESYQAASLVLARGFAVWQQLFGIAWSPRRRLGIIGSFPAAKVTLRSNCSGSVLGDAHLPVWCYKNPKRHDAVRFQDQSREKI